MRRSVFCFAAQTLALFNLSALEEAIPGDELIFEVQPEDSFLSVIEVIRQNLGLDQQSDIQLTLDGSSLTVKTSKYMNGTPRNYYSSLSAKEKEDVSFIMRSLANNSITKLTSQASSLKKAGQRIEGIHPLKYMLFVFTNEEFKVCARNIQGRSWVWRQFVDPIGASFQTEKDIGNLKPEYIQDFAHQLPIDINLINPAIQGNRWEEFINLLITFVPRKEGADRYHQ